MPTDITPEELGLRMVKTRMARGMTQKELANVLKVHPNTISKWERATLPMYRGTIDRILKWIGPTEGKGDE